MRAWNLLKHLCLDKGNLCQKSCMSKTLSDDLFSCTSFNKIDGIFCPEYVNFAIFLTVYVDALVKKSMMSAILPSLNQKLPDKSQNKQNTISQKCLYTIVLLPQNRYIKAHYHHSFPVRVFFLLSIPPQDEKYNTKLTKENKQYSLFIRIIIVHHKAVTTSGNIDIGLSVSLAST